MRWLVVFAAACSSHHPITPDSPSGEDAPIDAASCPRTAPPADRVRHVVISHPYDAAGANANTWEVLDLAATGELSRPGRTFQIGRATDGAIAFTPDGKVGLVAQDDGSIGVFALDDAGVPTPIAASVKGGFYAQSVVMAPTVDRAYVIDPDTRENGGGIYRVDIACDGSVTVHGMVAASKLPAALVFVPGTDRAVIAASDIGSSQPGADADLLTWGEPPTLLGGSDAFGDDQAIVGSAALTSDGGFFLMGDTSMFSGIPNRVAVVTVGDTGLSNPTVIPNIDDPFALVASPFGDVVLVADGFGNAMFVLENGATGWKERGEVTYVGPKPELPGAAVMIDAGALRGLVLMAENTGVRRVQFHPDGSVVDLGKFAVGTGDGTDVVLGAIGVTP
jgi:hypothetical protein